MSFCNGRQILNLWSTNEVLYSSIFIVYINIFILLLVIEQCEPGGVKSCPCYFELFNTYCLSKNCFIRHNTITGRWLTRFQAVWDPKQEDCVIVGSMAQPRRVEIFHETGKWVHSFLGGECLASVCSINAMHPTRYILAGGNSSGRVHVFMN